MLFRSSVEILDKDIDKALNQQIDNIIAQTGSKELAEAALGKKISDFKRSYRDDMKGKLLAEKYTSSLTTSINVSRGDVIDFFNTYNKMKELENAIAVVGMKHVGSTMVFNMIRIAYKLLEKKINDGNFTEKQEFDIYVTKSHGIDSFNHHILCEDEECNNISAHVKKFVTVIRDIRDSAISGFLRFHFNQSVNKKENLEKEIVKYGLNVFINSMHENILLYEKSLVKDPYIFQYEKYKENKIEEAIKLFEFLEIKSDKNFVAKVVDITENLPQDENLPIDLKDYTMNDKKLDYLLTNDHNTSNGRSQKWKTFFTKEQLNIIMEEPLIRNYLREMNYEIL